MNCPACSRQSKRHGTRRIGKTDEASYRICPHCGTRWTEYRRILLHSVRRNATPRLKALR